MTEGPIFLLDGKPVAEAVFASRAIDPARSVAVDACAGSGKTTLLVRRIARCLLEGAEPDSILAITFTRAAAQEMQVRIRGLLRRLAFDSDEQVLALLRDELFVPQPQAASLLPTARSLYERTLTARRGIDITTFHRWFWQLTRAGHRLSGPEPALELAERDAELLEEAWLQWLDQLREPERRPLAERFDRAVQCLGAWTTQSLLQSFVRQRTEWAASLGSDCDFADEVEVLGLAVQSHQASLERWLSALREQSAAFRTWSDQDLARGGIAALALHTGLLNELQHFASLLAHGGASCLKISANLDALVATAAGPGGAATAQWWQGLLDAVMTRARTPRAVKWQAAAFGGRIDAAGGADLVAARWQALAARVQGCCGLVLDANESLPLNLDLVSCAASFVCAYQALKQAHGVLDFVDLEAMAARLLRDESLSAYLQLRLDRRYRHLLFDEFQDTSSLQWTVIGNWLMAYAGAGAGAAPSVFIVGDPKQSIYRFRRAESRVFGAACSLLQDAFGASVLTTATTRRNAPAIMQALNRCLAGVMPNFREQATLAPAGASLVWRLPVDPPTTAAAAPADAPADSFDWLLSRRDEAESRRYAEGLAIGKTIEAARRQLAQQGGLLPYREIIVLARGRIGFVEYERALRSLGIPVVSDRKGGLLNSLESQDLVALLVFVRDQDDNLALAQLLRSPLIGLSAAQVGAIALERTEQTERTERSLMTTLRESGDPLHAAVVARLDDWISRARRLPVHDFLDSVLAQADAQATYARCVDPAQREIVVGNLQAMVGLALDHNGGRYPGLAPFLYHLGALDRLDDKDAPDEGRPVEHDAVRLMTVHGAKGLEADLVIVADAGAKGRPDAARFIIEWPPTEPRPVQTWFRLDASRLGYLSRQLDRRERELASIEDWNLLYVAATRARRGLVISAQPAAAIATDSWYERLQSLALPDAGCDIPGRAGDPDPGDDPDRAQAAMQAASCLTIPGLHLPPLPIGTCQSGEPMALQQGVQPGGQQAVQAMKAGVALHLALEYLARGMSESRVAELLAQRAGLAGRIVARALSLALELRSLPVLQPAFVDGAGLDEFELYDPDGQLLRIDRLARVGNELWIIDYKWSVETMFREQYALQLSGYRRALGQLSRPPLFDQGRPPAAIRTVLVDALARTVEFDIDRSVRGH